MQKTSMTPYFNDYQKGILRINRNVHKGLYELFYTNLDKTMQKMGSNAMTRAVRQYMKLLHIGFGSMAVGARIKAPLFGVYVGDSTQLVAIIVDIVQCSPDSGDDLYKSLMALYDKASEIAKLKQRVDDRSIERLNKLIQEMDELYAEIAGLIDYQRVVESAYYTLIRYIVADVDKGQSTKLFEHAIELFKSILFKAFKPVMNNIEDKDIRLLFDAAIDYVFTVSFTNLTHGEIIRNVSLRYGQEIASVLDKLNIKQYDSMEKVPHLLDALKILKTSPIAYNSVLSKLLGENGLMVLYSTYDIYIAWATLTTHYSLLFNMGPIDKNIQSQIETIVLNYKSRVRAVV